MIKNNPGTRVEERAIDSDSTVSIPLTSLIRVRATPELKELVRQAAAKEHQELPGWIRGVLAREVKRVLGEEKNGND